MTDVGFRLRQIRQRASGCVASAAGVQLSLPVGHPLCLPPVSAWEGLTFVSPLLQAVAAAAQAGLLQQQAELERKAAELEKKERELQSSAASINREYRFRQRRGSAAPSGAWLARPR